MSEKIAGVILAAGRGSRMKNLTANRPKCLLPLAGKPLLRWQLDAMGEIGIKKILVVSGYAGDCINGEFEKIENPRWRDTNMLSSLLCARDFAEKFFSRGGERLLISYSDIVWRSDHAAKLLRSNAPVAVAYDTLWENLWRLRFDDPLADAETFRGRGGFLVEIGGKTNDISEIQGQYMGLLSFSAEGWKILERQAKDLGAKADKTDMTAFLQILLARGTPIGIVPVSGGWCECDNAEDIDKYETAMASGHWSHDWREAE